MKLKQLLPLAAVALLAACHPPQKSRPALSGLAGLWITTDGALLYEEWTAATDSLLTGRSYSVNNGDTLLLEEMRMAVLNGKLHFFARVPGQNQAEEVGFGLTATEGTAWVFENLQHDYPNRIVYQLSSDTTLDARIENTKGNKQKLFHFKRLQ